MSNERACPPSPRAGVAEGPALRRDNRFLNACRLYHFTFRIAVRAIRGHKLEPEVPYIDRFLEPDSICLHIGASDGRHGFYMARRAKKGSVHCIEPSSYFRWVLAKLRWMFRYHNIKIHNIGISDARKTAYLVTPVKRNGHLGRGIAFVSDTPPAPDSRDEAWGYTGFISEEIELDSLDQFCRRECIGRVDFIRCDVEGSERSVLAGAEETVRRNRPILLLEVHPHALAQRFGSSAREIWSILSDHGYRMFYLQDDLVEATAFFDEPDRDYFCVPEEKVSRYGLAQRATADL